MLKNFVRNMKNAVRCGAFIATLILKVNDIDFTVRGKREFTHENFPGNEEDFIWIFMNGGKDMIVGTKTFTKDGKPVFKTRKESRERTALPDYVGFCWLYKNYKAMGCDVPNYEFDFSHVKEDNILAMEF